MTSFSANDPYRDIRARIWAQGIAFQMNLHELEQQIRHGLYNLLEQASRRYLVLPLPDDIRIDWHFDRRDITTLVLRFDTREEDWFIRVMQGSLRNTSRIYEQIYPLVRQIYSDFSCMQDERLLGEVMVETYRSQPDLTSNSDVNENHYNLNRQFRDYYQQSPHVERFFSLRNYAAEEEFYFPRLRAPNRLEEGTFHYEMLCDTERMLSGRVYQQPTFTIEQIEERETTLKETIRSILEGRESPHHFLECFERYRRIHSEEAQRIRYGGGSRRSAQEMDRIYSYRPYERARRARADARADAMMHMLQHIPPHLGMDYILVPGEGLPPPSEVDARGQKLLLENLTPQQVTDYQANKSFYVIGGQTGKLYEITHGRQQNVYEVDPKTRVRITGLCFLPAGGLCVGDTLLTQKISLELKEDEALKVAIPFKAR